MRPEPRVESLHASHRPALQLCGLGRADNHGESALFCSCFQRAFGLFSSWPTRSDCTPAEAGGQTCSARRQGRFSPRTVLASWPEFSRGGALSGWHCCGGSSSVCLTAEFRGACSRQPSPPRPLLPATVLASAADLFHTSVTVSRASGFVRIRVCVFAVELFHVATFPGYT